MTIAKDGHPLPASEEARRNEVPEDMISHKGEGDDAGGGTASGGNAGGGKTGGGAAEKVNPDGSSYPAGDLGRGPPSNQE